MLPIIKEIKQKLRTARGFTMVELMVVLLILGILAALAGTGLIAYVRLARFEHNESGARTVFQTAQIALTRKDTSGDMDTFLTELREVGTLGDHFSADGLSEQFGDGAAEKANAFNSQIYALYYDKANPDSDASKMVRGLLDPYVYDESLFNASIVVEVDSLTGQVYSAFYDTASDKLRFASDDGADGAMLIDDRSYGHRRGDSLVGYYSAEDTVNVVALSQTRLKVKNPQLINNETLTLNWSGNSKNGDINTIYDAEFSDATTNEPLFKLEIEWSRVLADPTHNNAQIKVYRPNADGNGWSETYQDYTFPLSYSKGRFILTLDAMCDANLLRAAENDGADLSSTKTTLFSITRLTDNVPKDVYVKMKARPNVNFQDLYTESKPQQSNTENTLFAAGSNAGGGTLKYFRHLYNLRWVNSGEYAFTGKNTALDWTDGSVTVYCSPEKKNAEPVAKVPSRTGEVVAWPTIPAIGKDVTNVGGHNLLKGLDNMAYVQKQGINGPIFTLIALDSHNYPTMGDVTREKLIQVILDAQLPDGGWNLSGENADPDMTAMAIQALAPYYKTNETVKAAVDKALEALSALQRNDGGFGSWGTVNSESCAQVIVALTALGIDPATDSRFVKNGSTVLGALAGFYVDGGGFKHTADGERNGMATEQGYYALAAYYRFANAQTRLYDMSDVAIQTGGSNTPATGDTGVLVWVIALPVTILAAAFVLKRKEREA